MLERPLCGECFGFAECDKCSVIEDHLLSRGITELGELPQGLHANPQSWGLQHVLALPVAVKTESDEPNFTWVLQLDVAALSMPEPSWILLRGWHDYTGWDCHSDLRTEWYATEREALDHLVDWERLAAGKLGVPVLT